MSDYKGSTAQGTTGSTQGMGTPQPSGAVQQAKETAGRLTDEALDKSGEMLDQARSTALESAQQQKSRVAESIGSVAQALRQTGESLNTQKQPAIGNFATQAADKIEKFSTDLESKSVNELLHDVENFARRDPELFLGGAVALGLLASRFFKASGRRSDQYKTTPSGGYGTQGSYGTQSSYRSSYDPYAAGQRSRVYSSGSAAGGGQGTFAGETSETYAPHQDTTTYKSSTSSEPGFSTSSSTVPPAQKPTPGSTGTDSSKSSGNKPNSGTPWRSSE